MTNTFTIRQRDKQEEINRHYYTDILLVFLLYFFWTFMNKKGQ